LWIVHHGEAGVDGLWGIQAIGNMV